MYEANAAVQDIITQLRAERAHVSDGSRVLEAIINHCSYLLRHELAGRLHDIALTQRAAAIKLYATSRQSVAMVQELLESAIADLEAHAAATG
jgi:superfamily II DNA helicase RecQ